MTLDLRNLETMATAYTAAWNSGSADAVAAFYAEKGRIVINRGEPWEGRAGVAEMARGFFADVPDLSLTCDTVRISGAHALFAWTFTGHDAKSGNPLTVCGWEEWELNEDLKVTQSYGWYDSDDYARQVEGR
ncbi:MAG TPA: nuclear transport factor 2 family protein [Kiloniellaceae bacterium]|nr:nuclear transport factor 2 family protein [Kiloniellaceae bacterium]